MVVDRGEIDERVAALKAAGVGMGNSPIAPLKTDVAAINTETDAGCQVQGPGLRKRMSYLRSNLFNPFDQITYFHDADADLVSFFDRYGFRTVATACSLPDLVRATRARNPAVPGRYGRGCRSR